MWDSPDPGSVRGKERHLFLFADKLLVTKRKKPDLPTDRPSFMFKSIIEVCNLNKRKERDVAQR